MQFLEFKNTFEDFTIFSLADIKAVEPDFNPVQLSQWQEKNYIKKIIKSKYIFSNLEITEQKLFLIANELREPSYISLETALNWYGIIPEGVYKITSVSTKKTIEYKTEIGFFEYRAIKPEAFFGDNIEEISNSERNYRIASPEKALADYFYYKDKINSETDIEALRLNQDIMENEIDYNLLARFVLGMNNKELTKRINKLIDYYKK